MAPHVGPPPAGSGPSAEPATPQAIPRHGEPSRRLVLVDTVVRSPVGKADYRWAKTVATQQEVAL